MLLDLGFPIKDFGNDGVEDLVEFMELLDLGFPTKELGNDVAGDFGNGRIGHLD